MNFSCTLPCAALIAAMSIGAAQASTLTGEDVTGELNFGGGSTNFFDSSFGFVPFGAFGNSSGSVTVTIADPLIEFGFVDFVSSINADFSANALTISQSGSNGSGIGSWILSFTSTAFVGAKFAELTDTFGNVDGTLVDDTLSFSFGGGSIGPSGTLSATYAISPAAVPVPASLPLLLGAFVGAGALLRRKSKAS